MQNFLVRKWGYSEVLFKKEKQEITKKVEITSMPQELIKVILIPEKKEELKQTAVPKPPTPYFTHPYPMQRKQRRLQTDVNTD